MFSFKNDYSEGAHPDILDALVRSNGDQEDGYGEDRHTLAAIEKIRNLIGDPKTDVHLLSGGTQTNLIAISSFLRPHEACISAASGHIATHEAGAIEATGHKLLTVAGRDGRLRPEDIGPVLEEHHFEHMVKPRIVYISNPSELGTVYTKTELTELSEFCRAKDLLLYLDGARLGCALACQSADLTLADIHSLTDAFFIGGTKMGALLGEALVVRNPALKQDLRYLIKQRGALLAKGRILGVQFEELFKDDLYFRLAEQANQKAQEMVASLAAEGCRFWLDSPTNQIFPIMDNQIVDELTREFDFYIWTRIDKNHSAIRLVTSWATSPAQCRNFVAAYKKAKRHLTGQSRDNKN